MKLHTSSLALVLLGTSLAGVAQDLKNAPQGNPTADPGIKPPAITNGQQTGGANAQAAPQGNTAAQGKAPDKASAYYHFQLAHIYEDMVAMSGRTEYATKAIEEYKLAIENDPGNEFLNSSLAELYAKTGRIRDAVTEAEEIIKRDPKNLDARRLLGRIYLRSLGDIQGGSQSQEILKRAILQYEQIVGLDPKSVEDHLLLGRLYRLNNQGAKAEQEFKQAVQLEPNSEEAVTTLSYLYIEEGDTSRALAILEAVPEAERTARVYSALGFTYEQKKDYKNAIAAFQKAVEQDKDNLDAVRGLAQNLMSDGQIEAALAQYQMIAEADPQDAQSYQRMAEIYRRDGKFDQALESLKKAQAIVPDSLEVPYNMAVIYEGMGRFDEASQILQDLLKRSEKADGTYTTAERNNRAIFIERLGSIYRQQNKTQASVDAFRKMLPLGEENAVRAYQEMIETYRSAKQWQQATAIAQEAAQKMPNDRGLQMVLAGQEADTGKPDEAIARVRAMLKGTPEDREVWITLAQMYSRLRRWKEAEEAIGQALKLSTKPDEKSYTMFVAASMYERQKKYDQAEDYFRKILAEDQRNAMVLNYLGYMLADRGTRLEEALGYIRKAVQLDPQNGAYLDSLGWAYFKLGKYEDAEQALRKAVERMGTDPTVHDHLADLYLKTGRLKQAVAHWERALDEWKRTVPAEVEPSDVAKVQKKLESARVKLAKQAAAAK